MRKNILTQLRFIAKISKSGEDRNIIIIPKDLKEKTDKMKGKHISVLINDEI
jgi:hypothetical protein